LRETSFLSDKEMLLTLLRSALADEVMATESNGYSINLLRRDVDLNKVGELRAKAIQLATESLELGGSAANAAIDVLHDALQSGDRNTDVAQEFAEVAETLRAVLTDASQDSGLRLAAHRALGWHATYGEGERRALARQVRAMMIVDDDVLLSRLMRSGPFMLDEDEDDSTDDSGGNQNLAVERYHRSVQKANEAIIAMVGRWLRDFTDEEVLVRLRTKMAKEFHEFVSSRSPDMFLRLLFTGRASLSLLAINGGRPTNAVDDAITRVAFAVSLNAGELEAERAALELIGESNAAANSVASAVMSGQSALNESQVRVVRALMRLDDSSVHNTLLTMVRWHEGVDQSLVMDMIKSAPIERDSETADAAAGLLVGGQVLPWSSVPTNDRSALLSRFVDTPKLQPHNIGELVTAQLKLDAASALHFLHTRIDAAHDREGYEALPHVGSMGLDFRSAPNLPAIIQVQVDWMLADAVSWRRQFIGIQLLELMLGSFANDAMALALTLIRSRDEPRVKLANRVLDQGPRHLVLREPEFVAEVVEAAQQLPEALAKRVYAGLHGSAEYGMHSRSVGADDPAEVALRDGARSIADRLPKGSALRAFYEDVARYASSRMAAERADDASMREPRQWS
jgi:hypothetical protein